MRKRSTFSILANMIKLVKPLSFSMFIAILFGTLGHLCAISIPVLGAISILSAINIIEISLNSLFILMICLGVLRGVFAYLEQNRNHYIAFKLLALIRDKIFSKLRKLCPAKLEGYDRGNLISIITSDIEMLEVFYAHTISPIIIAILVSSIMTIILSQFNIIFGITAGIAYFTTGVLLPMLTSKKAQDLYILERNEFGNLSSYYLDSLRGLKDIEQMNYGTKRLSQIEDKTDYIEKTLKKISAQDGLVSAIADMLVLGFSCIVLCESFYLSDGSTSFAYNLIPVTIMISSFGPVLALSRLSVGLSKMLAAGDRVLSLLDEEPEVKENLEGKKPEFNDIVINDLNFSYSTNNNNILIDFNTSFSKNKIKGIYGKSGSGKSTLLKLIMRFWNAPKDSIKISDTTIDEINTSYLREVESFMTQETDIFHKSIKDNIKIANLSATDEEVVIACKKASIHDFIVTLPNQYDTIVGELGGTISSGEAQRIGLARAFLHNSPLILLDEPTSNLDSLNEGIILKSLKQEQENKTIILVSHRKSTMSICDDIISVENGRIS
ncbi:MAG: ABC transporter ATP-binding protein [bacterium]